MTYTLSPATAIRPDHNGRTTTILISHYLEPFAQRKPIEETKRPHNLSPSEAHRVTQSRDEVLRIVDYYDDASVDESLKFYKDPYLRKYASADGPNITVSNKPEDLELQTIYGDRIPDDDESGTARGLLLAIIARHRHPGRVSLDTIWDIYQALPEPRPVHISARTRLLLTAALASGERKDQRSMLRYFSVIADIKYSGFSLTSFQWNTAISFATGYVATITEVEVEAALKLWREMEKEANVQGNDVTFNILFDAASKAGKFTLAEMIYKEMIQRGFGFNRYHHVSLIHFFGLKQDSSGVRAGYREMVEAGEIIDTVVLNCLIASFIRCGEEQSAEHVYEKMKASNKNLPTLPHRDYTLERAITKVFSMFARVSKKHPSMQPGFQQSALLSPNLQTYRILLNHYGLRLGILSKVVQFLDEMKTFMVPLNGVIFLALFQSFAVHGGAGSDWNAKRLDSVWHAFLDAMDAEADGLYISTWLAMAVLGAHARYATKDQLFNVYECLRSRWDFDEENAQYMLHFLENLLRRDMQGSRLRWESMVG
ncbi:hypothetical protein EKO27_g8770 [Xylaria grammica]|uniref:Pentacotripeptide-repeat region of PRORP domain-containing protein n=1 Tax=Xylaria grammica TaxID=363999 RepID=A0A439CVX4_9PEZI|nr:hypothetical protein EKO27_g8770 [Xylaria grammica]